MNKTNFISFCIKQDIKFLEVSTYRSFNTEINYTLIGIKDSYNIKLTKQTLFSLIKDNKLKLLNKEVISDFPNPFYKKELYKIEVV